MWIYFLWSKRMCRGWCIKGKMQLPSKVIKNLIWLCTYIVDIRLKCASHKRFGFLSVHFAKGYFYILWVFLAHNPHNPRLTYMYMLKLYCIFHFLPDSRTLFFTWKHFLWCIDFTTQRYPHFTYSVCQDSENSWKACYCRIACGSTIYDVKDG